MKRTYAIQEWKATENFRSHLANDPGTIQMFLPLAEIAQLLRQRVFQCWISRRALQTVARSARQCDKTGRSHDSNSARRSGLPF